MEIKTDGGKNRSEPAVPMEIKTDGGKNRSESAIPMEIKTDTDKTGPGPQPTSFSFASIATAPRSIFEKANHFLPRSLREAPK